MLLLFTLLLSNVPLSLASLPTAEAKNIQSPLENIAKPGCKTRCGNLTVPYPFGIGVGSGCSLDKTFDMTCNSTYNPPRLFIKTGNIQISKISGFEMWSTDISVTFRCYNESGGVTSNNSGWTNLRTTPFVFSQKNKFTVVGCDDVALITGADRNGGNFSTSCYGLCNKPADVLNGTCSGIGCCQASIPRGLKRYASDTLSLTNHTGVFEFNRCGFAFLGEETSFQFRGVDDLSNATEFYSRISSDVPTVLEWVIESNQSCVEANVCKGNSSCTEIDFGGYRCSCNKGYQGNPYLDPGCHDINECDVNSNISCYGVCINTEGSYTCKCLPGYTGNADTQDGCQPNNSNGSKFPVMVFTLALVFGLVAILSGLIGIFFGLRKRKLIKLREKFFEKNGGVFLKQKLNTPGTSDSVTMFTAEQLRTATDNYSEKQIVGCGGYGVVYKGILPDKRVVAVKKSKLVDGTQAEQFINEVLILTQVIHRNVVKLLGCCLEEEVPVLVYEFISNNTLFYHIHHRSGGTSWLSWENRLRVAIEAASALGYLHSQAGMPIIHRDVKSTNILLDENYTTKISDFGASRLVPLDHDQVTTLVQGTLGYLDPEYFHTSQLTDKSDVYSFGVVLAELITGQKPLSADRTNEEKNLATYFVKAVKESRLFEIVEPRVLREGTLEQLQVMGDLVKRCLSLHGNDRPTMKEVAMELEGLKRFKTHQWSQNHTHEEARSLILEVEPSDLYDVPLIPYSISDWGSYSSTSMTFQESKPR
uniref:wall-associated receptor kinase 5-like n=1 Tax=Erigeron canadensis TaxID=72917 RepID=UPI001CB9476D|nr:wall-associated receptor kinase 5-like [Erigeron canadensis]